MNNMNHTFPNISADREPLITVSPITDFNDNNDPGERQNENNPSVNNERAEKKYNMVRYILIFLNFVYIVLNILCYGMAFGMGTKPFQMWFLINAFYGIVTIWKSSIDRNVSRIRYVIDHFISYSGIFIYYLERDTISDDVDSDSNIKLVEFVIASKVVVLLTEFLFGLIGHRIYKIYDRI